MCNAAKGVRSQLSSASASSVATPARGATRPLLIAHRSAFRIPSKSKAVCFFDAAKGIRTPGLLRDREAL